MAKLQLAPNAGKRRQPELRDCFAAKRGAGDEASAKRRPKKAAGDRRPVTDETFPSPAGDR